MMVVTISGRRQRLPRGFGTTLVAVLLLLLVLLLPDNARCESSSSNGGVKEEEKNVDMEAQPRRVLDDDDDDAQASSSSSYGTEITWPSQRFFSDSRWEDMVEGRTESENANLLAMHRLQNQRYQDYITGCYRTYTKSRCRENEYDRVVQINRRQPAIQQNFTNAGYALVEAPVSSFTELKRFWDLHAPLSLQTEQWPHANIYTNHWKAPTKTLLVDDPDLPFPGRQRLVEDVQTILERWAGVPLQPTSMYGIRVYTRNSILSMHVDRVPLVISAIINVAQDGVEEPWPLEVIDHDGVAHNVTMQPGDMVLYESHSILHGRPFPFHGRHYANIFVHFEPVGYTEELERRMQRKSSQQLFEEALMRHGGGGDDATPKRSIGSSNKKAHDNHHHHHHKHDLPVHIKEGTVEAVRWRQQFVYRRYEEDENGTKKKKSKHKIRTSGVTSAHVLAATGDLQGLRAIAATHPQSLDEADSNGWKPIHEAARSGKTKVLAFLLEEHKVAVNDRTNDGEGASPLWWAQHVLPPGHEAIALLKRHGGRAVGPNDDYEDVTK